MNLCGGGASKTGGSAVASAATDDKPNSGFFDEMDKHMEVED